MNKKLPCLRVALLLFMLMNIFSCHLAPGSYLDAETYTLNYPEEDIKNAISKFKLDNPEYIVPKVTVDNKSYFELNDGKTKDGNWFVIYFYYPEENTILYTWIRFASKTKTTFAFVSINRGLTLGNWRDINKDLNSTENEKQKKKFEERILNPIKEMLRYN